MSDKSVRDEFDLTQQEIEQGIFCGALQYRKNSAHGNPYLKLLRNEVKLYVEKIHGKDYLAEKISEKELNSINGEINSLKRTLAALEKIKIELIKNQKTDE